jgi:hypothetical protein
MYLEETIQVKKKEKVPCPEVCSAHAQPEVAPYPPF